MTLGRIHRLRLLMLICKPENALAQRVAGDEEYCKADQRGLASKMVAKLDIPFPGSKGIS